MGLFINKFDVNYYKSSRAAKDFVKYFVSKKYSKAENLITNIAVSYLNSESIGRRIFKLDNRRLNDATIEYKRRWPGVAYSIDTNGGMAVIAGNDGGEDSTPTAELMKKLKYKPRITANTFEIASCPILSNSEISNGSELNMLNWIRVAINAINKQENINTFNLLDGVAVQRGTQVVKNMGVLSRSSVLECFKHMMAHNVTPEYIILNIEDYLDVFGLENNFIKGVVTIKNAFDTKNFGYIQDTSILVSKDCPKGRGFVVAGKEYTGYFVEQQSPYTEFVAESRQLRKGFVLAENVGVLAMNDWSISKIEIVK